MTFASETGKMKKLSLNAIVVLLACLSLFAQDIQPVLAPAEVVLNFNTKMDVTSFTLEN